MSSNSTFLRYRKTKSGQTNRYFNQRFQKHFRFRNLNSFRRDHITIIVLLMLFQMFSGELNFCALLVWVQVKQQNVKDQHLVLFSIDDFYRALEPVYEQVVLGGKGKKVG